jgi:hypothetical protein
MSDVSGAKSAPSLYSFTSVAAQGKGHVSLSPSGQVQINNGLLSSFSAHGEKPEAIKGTRAAFVEALRTRYPQAVFEALLKETNVANKDGVLSALEINQVVQIADNATQKRVASPAAQHLAAAMGIAVQHYDDADDLDAAKVLAKRYLGTAALAVKTLQTGDDERAELFNHQLTSLTPSELREARAFFEALATEQLPADVAPIVNSFISLIDVQDGGTRAAAEAVTEAPMGGQALATRVRSGAPLDTAAAPPPATAAAPPPATAAATATTATGVVVAAASDGSGGASAGALGGSKQNK